MKKKQSKSSKQPKKTARKGLKKVRGGWVVSRMCQSGLHGCD